ncbi:hypothetical protein BZA05DRAFT_259695 [Tricharina praecox]|uniref:uncharacterized protein n=1 Tax=Tricharina praecox TaxID=43433 RepID=UPI00221ED6ED|nr:uncharacterized protein BZA05DRAFT_259695 [Tricharina praecox]KAI5854174.1 hypothetical protein BZA05DRAFT_259695 [Tricharina praecox]
MWEDDSGRECLRACLPPAFVRHWLTDWLAGWLAGSVAVHGCWMDGCLSGCLSGCLFAGPTLKAIHPTGSSHGTRRKLTGNASVGMTSETECVHLILLSLMSREAAATRSPPKNPSKYINLPPLHPNINIQSHQHSEHYHHCHHHHHNHNQPTATTPILPNTNSSIAASHTRTPTDEVL